MPRQLDQSTCDLHGHDEPSHLSDETLARYAQLLAAGEISWPQELDATEIRQIVARAREHRRRRLVTLVASRIAAEMLAERGDRKVSSDD